MFTPWSLGVAKKMIKMMAPTTGINEMNIHNPERFVSWSRLIPTQIEGTRKASVTRIPRMTLPLSAECAMGAESA